MPVLEMNRKADPVTDGPTETVSQVDETKFAPAAAKPADGGMKKSWKPSWTIINFWLDFALGVNFLLLMWFSAILQFVFPAGASSAGYTLWGADAVTWQNLQFTTLCVLTAGVTLHVMFHWSWILGVINRRIFGREVIKSDGTDTLLGVGLIALIIHVLAIGVLVARYWIVAP